MTKARGRDLLRNIDPRAVIACVFILSVIIACVNTLISCLCALAMAGLCLILSRPAWPEFFRRLASANIFILFIWLITPWTTPGDPVIFTGPLSPTRQGLWLCLLVSLKANALIIFFMAFISPMPLTKLGAALSAMRCPDKLVWLFLLMERNIHILGREWHNLMDAARLRGFAPATNFHTYRALASLLAILLVRAGDRGERRREAMLLRGFNGSLPLRADFRLTGKDLVFVILMLFASCALICLNAGFSHD